MYSFRFRRFIYFFFLHFDIFSCKFSICARRCTLLALLGAVAEILMCRDYELRNRRARVPPPHPAPHTLYMHIDEMPSIFFFIHARPVPRIIHDAPRFCNKSTPPPHLYPILRTPSPVYLWYTYYKHIYIYIRRCRAIISLIPSPSQPPDGNSFRSSRRRRRHRRMI